MTPTTGADVLVIATAVPVATPTTIALFIREDCHMIFTSPRLVSAALLVVHAGRDRPIDL
jgi:hypothetical protein